MKVKLPLIVLSLFILQNAYSGSIAENRKEPPHGGQAKKIVMVWDLIGSAEDNMHPDKRIVHSGLDVISPTWFCIKNENGDVASIASREYAEWAHEQGLKVWALFENNSDDSLTNGVLRQAGARTRVINQIARYAEEYRLDGINIDFEAMSRETGRLFEVFIAELYRKLQPMGITLSVDITAPGTYQPPVYDISLIAGHSDYVVLMTYDQHHSHSSRSGPVAAIAWVKQEIENTLRYVSGEKLILGVPFYTIVWTEEKEDGVLKTSSELKGMKETYEQFDTAAGIWGRDRATQQIYAEYESDQKCFKVWLEDDHSLSLKLDTVNDYELAGMSAWRRGLEWPEIWDMILAYYGE